MVRFSGPALLAALLVAEPAAAQDASPAEPALTVTGGVTLTSQYRFRGISLSDEKAALQGTVNLNHESGFYAGAWGSSLDGFGELGSSNVELDLYAGYRREVGDGVTVDGGLLYYAYPGSEGGDFEFFEPYANVSAVVGPATAKLGLAYAPEQDALGGNDNLYLFNDNSLAIVNTPFSLTSHLGYSTGGSAAAFGSDYVDWSLGASATWRNFSLGVAYVGTDIGDAQALRVGATRDIVDDAVVLSLTASF